MWQIMKAKMNKVHILILIMLAFMPGWTAMAQDVLPAANGKNAALQKNILDLEKDSVRIAGQIAALAAEIKADSATNARFVSEYESLTGSVSAGSIAALRASVDALQERHTALLQSVDSVNRDIAAKTAKLKQIDSEVGEMDVYSEIQMKQTYEDNLRYLGQKYSMMSEDVLAGMAGDMDRFRKLDGFAEYKERVDAARANKKAFERAWHSLNSGKDYLKTIEMRDAIIPLLKIEADNLQKGEFKLSEEQFNELDSIDISLSRYNSGIRELKKVVEQINSDEDISKLRGAKEPQSKNELIRQINEYLLPEEGSDQAKIHDRYFKMIPYLGHLLDLYGKELNSNPFVTPAVEKTIIELEVR